jgi:hypothetical protein
VTRCPLKPAAWTATLRSVVAAAGLTVVNKMNPRGVESNVVDDDPSANSQSVDLRGDRRGGPRH